MASEYMEKAYLPLAKSLRRRLADECAQAKELRHWSDTLQRSWTTLHVGEPTVTRNGALWRYSVAVSGGDVPLDAVRVELFADERQNAPAQTAILHRDHAVPGTVNGHVYSGEVDASRPAEHYTVRVVPHHPAALIPAELPLIAWQR